MAKEGLTDFAAACVRSRRRSTPAARRDCRASGGRRRRVDSTSNTSAAADVVPGREAPDGRAPQNLPNTNGHLRVEQPSSSPRTRCPAGDRPGTNEISTPGTDRHRPMETCPAPPPPAAFHGIGDGRRVAERHFVLGVVVPIRLAGSSSSCRWAESIRTEVREIEVPGVNNTRPFSRAPPVAADSRRDPGARASGRRRRLT